MARMRLIGRLATIPAVAMAASWAPASAQAVGNERSEEPADIIVTAQKSRQRLIDVPASVSVISAEAIEAKGVPTLRDFQYSVPNLVFTGVSAPGEGGLSIRGIAVNSGGPGFESGAGVYIDDVFQGRATANSRTLADAEQVEILRGPQGTLYGKNTISGAINITTIQPSDELIARLTAGYGNWNAFETAGVIAGPLSETVGAKAVAYFDRRDGFYRNEQTGRDNSSYRIYGGKFQITARPSAALTIDLTVDYDRTKDDYVGFEIVDTGLPQFGTTGFVAGDRSIAQDNPTSDRELWGASARIGYTFASGHKLTSISSYRSDTTSGGGDLDRTPFDLSFQSGRTKAETYAQELRINSPAGERLRYVGGIYVFYQKVAETTQTTIGDDLAAQFADAGIVDVPYDEASTVKSDSYAVFGNAEYDLTSQFTVAAGLRYNRERKRLAFRQLGAATFGFAQIPGIRDKTRDNDFSPMASVRYALSPQANIYAKVAFGSKSGGWNTRFISENIPAVAGDDPLPVTASNISFATERLINYEAGVKGSAFGRKLTYAAAVFYLDYKDIQVAQFDISGASKITNAASARSYGAELEIEAKPAGWLQFNVGVGYTNAKFRDFPTFFTDQDPITGDDIVRQINLKGLPLLQAPKWTVSASARFSLDTASAGKFYLSPEFSYRSNRLTDATDDPFFVIPSATLVNARLGWTDPSDRFEITAWVDNFFNVTFAEERIVENLFFGPQVLEAYNPSRTFGIRGTVRF